MCYHGYGTWLVYNYLRLLIWLVPNMNTQVNIHTYKHTHIHTCIYTYLVTNWFQWVFKSQTDIFFSSDRLLCHDDELQGRRIAFIFYLVPPWTKEDGGKNVSNCLSIQLSIYLSICLFIIYPSIHPFTHPLIHPSIHLFIHLSICLSSVIIGSLDLYSVDGKLVKY